MRYILIMAFALFTTASQTQTISGIVVRVIDGDTFTYGNGTPCDGRSKSRSYDRVVAQCFINKDDIAILLIKAGHAKGVKKYSGGYYIK